MQAQREGGYIALPNCNLGTRRGVGGYHHVWAALPPGKDPVSIVKRLGGPQAWSGWIQKISPPPGFTPRTIQPIASRYTNYSIQQLPNANLRQEHWLHRLFKIPT